MNRKKELLRCLWVNPDQLPGFGLTRFKGFGVWGGYLDRKEPTALG